MKSFSSFAILTVSLCMLSSCALLNKLVDNNPDPQPVETASTTEEKEPNRPIIREANIRQETTVTEPEEIAVLPDPKPISVAVKKPKAEDPSIEPIVEKPAEKKKKEPAKQKPKEPEVSQEEFERSTSAVSVSKETFVEDKTIILSIIGDLDQIMQDQNYDGWLNYLDTSSINYWSQRTNLQKAANRLPVKGIRLTTLEDYFRYVFISSRTGKKVDEIRYDTNNSVKAVQVTDDIDVVYYNFLKMDGIWKLHLPTLSE